MTHARPIADQINTLDYSAAFAIRARREKLARPLLYIAELEEQNERLRASNERKDQVIAERAGLVRDAERRKSWLTTWLVTAVCIGAAGWTLLVIGWMER